MFILRGLKKIGLWCPIVFLSFVAPASAASFFDDWRFPDETDITDDWEIYRQEGREFYTVAEDFNGDGNQDEAWILIRNDDTEWGLFVFLNADSSDPEIIQLGRTKMDDCPPQCMGLALTPPGNHITVCGKGYRWACDPDGRKYVDTKYPAIDYFRFESASSFFYWNEDIDRFERIWTSD